MAKKQRSWEHRLRGSPHELTVGFVQSLSYDKRLYKYDIAGSIAHARMLARQKLITRGEFSRIKAGLLEIADEIDRKRFRFSRKDEDIHMAIEAALIEKTGPAGEKLHTGRSRNDQVATDLRLWVRYQTQSLQKRLTAVQKSLVKLADKHSKDLMPAYTHLQRAQPVVIGAYLLSYVEQLQRDYVRLGHCRQLLNVCPLGSGAIAGSTLPLDRKTTADELGFAEISYNSIDSVGDRDFAAEFIFDCAMIAGHLSRWAEDWIIFSSNEFGFLHIDDSFCTSSSMMPQKRNPDVLELIRAKAGSVYGSLMAILTILKGLPSGYNRDLQEDKIHVFAASDAVESSLEIAAELTAHSDFKAAQIAATMNTGFLDATAAAEYLVDRGVPFRRAHGVVGQIVADYEKCGKELHQLTLAQLRKFSTAFDKDVYDRLGSAHVVKHYVTEGAGGPKQTKQQIAYWKKQLAQR